MAYLWFKWLHIISVISWMAGILYLYRLFINHRERGLNNQDIHELLVGMEYRLYQYITVPAMLTAVFAGCVMIALVPEMLKSGWLQAKLVAVVALVWATFHAGALRLEAKDDPNTLPSSRTLRIINEVPAVLMMIIVGLVVFKAF